MGAGPSGQSGNCLEHQFLAGGHLQDQPPGFELFAQAWLGCQRHGALSWVIKMPTQNYKCPIAQLFPSPAKALCSIVRLYIRNSEQQAHAFKFTPPREGELHACGHTSSAIDSIANSNLGRSKHFLPPIQNLNIQRRFHGRNTRGLLVRHRSGRQTVHARRSGLQPSHRRQRQILVCGPSDRRECRQAAVPGPMLID